MHFKIHNEVNFGISFPLNKKLLLGPATEAIEEQSAFKLAEKVKTKGKKVTAEPKLKKKLIIEDDDK